MFLLLLLSGLVALRSEEVLELMMVDYPLKFSEYQMVLQEREFQATLRHKMREAKKMAVRENVMCLSTFLCVSVHVC